MSDVLLIHWDFFVEILRSAGSINSRRFLHFRALERPLGVSLGLSVCLRLLLQHVLDLRLNFGLLGVPFFSWHKLNYNFGGINFIKLTD